MLSSGVRLLWSPLQQLRVMKVCSDVTLSVWTTLLHLRRAAFAGPSDFSEEKAGAENLKVSQIQRNVNRPLDDVEALRSLEKRLHTFAGAKGDVRHR